MSAEADPVRSLAPSLVEPLRLVLRDGCSYREAAERLGRPPTEVARQLRAALQEIHRWESAPPRRTPGATRPSPGR